ncbi:uncharacterized protein LOC133391282 [Anopheles gambiae]|uniref:uncharacterized protein LOC133391282 n=1 Tax=Anopheles gambiae TaxID=7165 RepID=UPI002AC921CF|nr:uncharacterized protein LOC133391282 [Anopheles gambiae]
MGLTSKAPKLNLRSTMQRHDGNYYRERKRELEEFYRICNEQLANVDLASSNIPWPDLLVENHPVEVPELLADYTSFAFSSGGEGVYDSFIDYVDENEVEKDDDLSFVHKLSLNDALRHLAIISRLSRFTIRTILAIIRKHFQAPVPKSSQTLMKTPIQVGKQIFPISGGQMWYRGIQSVLQNYFE